MVELAITVTGVSNGDQNTLAGSGLQKGAHRHDNVRKTWHFCPEDTGYRRVSPVIRRPDRPSNECSKPMKAKWFGGGIFERIRSVSSRKRSAGPKTRPTKV